MHLYSNLIVPYQASPRFETKSGNFVAVLSKNTHVISIECILLLEINIISYARFMTDGVGIIDKFLVNLHHFLPNQCPYWRDIE